MTGTVNYNGKPLQKGTITFATDGRPPTQMDIFDGKYAGQAMVGSNKIVDLRQAEAADGGRSPSRPWPMAGPA